MLTVHSDDYTRKKDMTYIEQIAKELFGSATESNVNKVREGIKIWISKKESKETS